MWTAKPSASSSEVPKTSTVQIEDGALGVARSALKEMAYQATAQVHYSINNLKSQQLAADWAKLAASYGIAYLKLAEVRYL